MRLHLFPNQYYQTLHTHRPSRHGIIKIKLRNREAMTDNSYIRSDEIVVVPVDSYQHGSWGGTVELYARFINLTMRDIHLSGAGADVWQLKQGANSGSLHPLPRRLQEETLCFVLRATSRPRLVAHALQRRASALWQILLREDADADVARRKAAGRREDAGASTSVGGRSL